MMTDERLTEIEAIMESPDDGCRPWSEAGQELLAEVRRLRRALALPEASRGTPSPRWCHACQVVVEGDQHFGERSHVLKMGAVEN